MKFCVGDIINWGADRFVPIISIEYGSYVTPYGRVSSIYDSIIKLKEK
jgi:hypothetical protein